MLIFSPDVYDARVLMVTFFLDAGANMLFDVFLAFFTNIDDARPQNRHHFDIDAREGFSSDTSCFARYISSR